MTLPDISVIVTAHHEGRLAHFTISSLFRSLAYAAKNGITTEVIIVLDKPDQQTLDYFSRYADSKIKLSHVENGDLGLSRNHGVSLASGKYIAFLDADNLFAKDWIYRAVNFLSLYPPNIVVHPEYHVIFEGNNLVWKQISSSDRNFKLDNLIENNYWDAVCAGHRDVFIRFPYETTMKSPGFGFEDWHFNCQTLAGGICHFVVPDTVHFLRVKKNGSLLAYTVQTNRMIRPTKLFESSVLTPLIKGKTPNNQAAASVKVDVPSAPFKVSRLKSIVARFSDPVFHRYPRLYPWLVRQARSSCNAGKPHTAIFPDWLIDEWKAMHSIEPQIFPEQHLLQSIPFYSVPESRIGRYYLPLCEMFGNGVTHVFLVPWLKMGGADLVALNYVEALKRINPKTEITVISTLNADSPWSGRLPQGVRFVEFGKVCKELASEEQEKLLSRLLLQMSPKVIHNINSDLGYRIFVKYGKALGTVSKLFACSFCKDVTEEGKDVGYPFSYLPACFDSLTAVLSDNKAFLERLHGLYAFERSKLITHYQPHPVSRDRIYMNKFSKKGRMDILWAGRIDRQKRPDILAAVAEASVGMPLHFHVYGSPVLDRDIYSERLKTLPNVTICGAFDGLMSLPADKFDLFLYTSQWDGLPNVLLEAISLGLPIIAPNVGAVGELIEHRKTGFLIDQFDDVQGYVNCLREILADGSNLSTLVVNAFSLVNCRHSWQSFVAAVENTGGYVVPSEFECGFENVVQIEMSVGNGVSSLDYSEENLVKEWGEGKASEVNFWDEWFKTKGLSWPDQYKERMNPSQPFQANLKQFLPEQQVVAVLDVGAGPLTLLGKKMPGKELLITAVDPLAAEYDVIIRKYGIAPPVRTQYALAERLSDVFPENTFDFVHICNALDHSYDPIAGIRQMIRVVKPGCCVFMSHALNEAENENYAGFHQWNFSVESDKFIIWNKHSRIDVNDELGANVDLNVFGNGGHTVVIRKVPG